MRTTTFFLLFLWPFSYKITFLFLDTKPARLPFLVGFFHPIHTHTLNRLQNKAGIKPIPGNPPEHDVTKLHLHMTSDPLFLWPFSHKITFLLLGTELARLPALVGFLQPIHIHTLSQLQHKMGIKPIPENPPEHDVTKLLLHMTSHPLLHTRV